MEHQTEPMSIGNLAKACGVGVETIRFYQRKGLLETPSAHHGYRTYEARHADRLRFIRRAQAVGFTLDEIADLLRLNDTTDHAQARRLAQEKVEQIEQRIQQLRAMAGALHHLISTCERGPTGTPCPIIRMALAASSDSTD